MKKTAILIPLLLILLAAAGCNLPEQTGGPQSPEMVFTQSALTVAAQLTQAFTQAPATQTALPASLTPQQASTPRPTATDVPAPCNLAGFEADVTFPDNSLLVPGQTFVKTWRLRNLGTCTWTSDYRAAYESGAGLGLSAGYSQPLTAGRVAPGQTVDISVTLAAPTTAGTYRGDWSLHEPGGRAFGTSFIVLIKVAGTPTTLTLTPVAGEGGTLRADGALFMDDYTVGDSAADSALQSFMSFNIGSLPVNATITELKVDLGTGGLSQTGTPFSLGCLGLYPQEYVALEAGDFFTGSLPSAYVQWCSSADLAAVQLDNDLKTLIQSRLGTARIQVRLQHLSAHNANAGADSTTFSVPRLILTYYTP